MILISHICARRDVNDNIILKHDLVKLYNRKGISKRCMIKVDTKKIYDSIEWSFMEQILYELKFPSKVIKWIMQCITTVSYLFQVNLRTTKPFKTKRGVRQWGSMCPFLFVLDMDYLTRNLKTLHTNQEFHYHQRCEKWRIIADDLLIHCRGNIKSVRSLYK